MRDGYFGDGARRRQRFRCYGRPDGGHRFTPPVQRLIAQSEECLSCEHDLAVFEGPTSPRQYVYTTHEVALALAAVASGQTYIEASVAAREAAGRRYLALPARQHQLRLEAAKPHGPNGGLAADWTEVFAPVIFTEYAPTSWPEALLLDSTHFYRWRGGVKRNAFHLLGAYGYSAGSSVGRIYHLAAYPTAKEAAWADFLARYDGAPRVVVADQNDAIRNAVHARWRGTATPEIVSCTWHLANNARKALAVNGVRPPKDGLPAHPVLTLLSHAFDDARGWLRFARAVRADPALPNVHRWLDLNEQAIREQIGRRADPDTGYRRPGPESTGPLEQKLAAIRPQLARRVQGLTNRERTNRMLMLIQLRLNGQLNEQRWAHLVREELKRQAGTPAHQRQITDRTGRPTL